MKKLYITFLALLLTLAMILPTGVVSAGSGQVDVNGNITFTSTGFIPDKIVGEKGVVKGTIYFDVFYTGDIVGNGIESHRVSLNMNPVLNFKTTSMGIQTFTGIVLGQSGTFTANVRHQMKEDGSGKVEQTILSGTGDLANLHGTLVFMIYRQGDGSYTGEYSGTLHFAP
jgi:hypothetical protein